MAKNFRPLFGARCSVENIHDSFGDVMNVVKSNESERTPSNEHSQQPRAASTTSTSDREALPTTNKGGSLPERSSKSISSTRKELDRHHERDHDLGGLLTAAALMASKNDHSHPDDHDQETDVEEVSHRQSDDSDTAVHDTDTDTESDAAQQQHERDLWKQTADEANAADRLQENKRSTRFGKTLKKVDARIRSTLGVFPAPTAKEKRSPYSVGTEDYADSHLSLGAAELLQEASLDHLDDLYSDDEDDDDAAESHDKDQNDRVSRPSGEKMEKFKSSLEKSEQSAVKARNNSNDVNAGDTVQLAPKIEVSPQDKLKAIIEEFGECPSVSAPDVPEEVIADIPSVLIKTIMIKGSLFLTNRRLCFLAFIPVSKPNTPAQELGNIQAPIDPNVENPILKAGPAILHRVGKMRPKRHVWLELRKHSLTAYPASNKLYKPLGSVRLADLNAILPTDWSQPHVIRFMEGSRYSSLEFKTQEAALDWRKELEGAAFHAHNTSEKVRISLPLDRVVNIDTGNFLQVAQIIHVDVLDSRFDGSAASEERHGMQHSWSMGHSVVDCPKNPGFKCHITKVAFGITVSRLAFIDLIKEALIVPSQKRKVLGDQKLLTNSPAPLLDIESEKDNETGDPDGLGQEDAAMPLAEKFCRRFGLKIKPEELKIVKAELVRSLPTHGTMAIGLDYLCFWRRAVGRDLKIKVPLNDIRGVEMYRSMLWHHFGLVLHITAHADMYFDFLSKSNRDMVLDTLNHLIHAKSRKDDVDRVNTRQSEHSNSTQATKGDDASSHPLTAAHAALQNAQQDVPIFDANTINLLPKLVNVEPKFIKNSLRIAPMRMYCLTIGSRGDVQPYIALCKALKEHGHTTVIVSHPEYRSWVEGHGIEFRGVGGDPAALMKLSVEHKIFSPAFFRESIGKFRVWLDELLRECWEECQGADLLIESPSTMAGIHVAEGLGIPYFRAFTMPWTKTTAYPQAFSVPAMDMGASYNSSSYVLFDQIMWVATSGQINRWRKHMVGIGPTDLNKLDTESVPFIYNFSPAVVPVPNDWGDRVKVSGYWFLDNPESDWKPPKEMEDFIAKAQKDGKKTAYIGFGSITIDNAEEVSENIMQAVKQADIRAIVAKGWSGRGGSSKKKPKPPKRQSSQMHRVAYDEHEAEETTEDEASSEPEIPSEVFVVDSVPHDWLFPQIDIAMHHGGAGTTGASLRAGLVTLIKPFFGDQFFWAQRVQKLGSGARVHSLSTADLADALKAAAQDRIMVEKAQEIGQKIRSEDGVSTAIQFLYSNISLAERRGHRRDDRDASREASYATSHGKSAGSNSPSPSSTFSNPLARLTGRTQASMDGATPNGDQDRPHRSSTQPATGITNHVCKSQTISESPVHEDVSDAGEGPAQKEEKRSSTFFSLPSLSGMTSLPHTGLTSAFKEALTLHSSSTDTTQDGDEIPTSPSAAADAATAIAGNMDASSKEDNSDEAKMSRLKGYKNAKAEDIRRRNLLLQKLAAQREQRECDAKKQEEAKPELNRGASQKSMASDVHSTHSTHSTTTTTSAQQS